MKPIIGILGSAIKTITEYTSVVCMDKYRNAIIKLGGIPMMILPTQYANYDDIRPAEMPRMTSQEIEDLKRQVDLCDGILLPGGNRIYEYAYEVLEYACKKDVPCLGICLGMQTMACCKNDRNSKILTRIDSNINHKNLNPEYVHFVNIEKDTKLYSILKNEKIRVNSKHNYCIKEANNLKISAYSEDGIIEAIELEDKKFFIGVQWHPEDLLDDNMENIIRGLIDFSKK